MSKFIEHVLDLETYSGIKDQRWPSLKIVFDNLRCYPILALLAIAVKLQLESKAFLSIVSGYFLLGLTVFLLMAVLMQSTFMFFMLTVGLITGHEAAPQRKDPNHPTPWPRTFQGKIAVAIAIFLGLALILVCFRTAWDFLNVVTQVLRPSRGS